MIPKVLVLEDERNVGDTLVERLNQDGFSTFLARTADAALSYLRNHPVQLTLLDIGLPESSGYEVAHWIKDHQPSASIIFLTAQSDEENRVRGLELGAEDYVVKPFHYKELVLRMRNALKRTQFLIGQDHEIELGRARVSFSRFQLQVDSQTHVLTHKECAFLKLLYERKEEVVSRDEILNFVWTDNECPSPRTVDNFVVKFRRLIEEKPSTPKLIKSIRGVGYQLLRGPL